MALREQILSYSCHIVAHGGRFDSIARTIFVEVEEEEVEEEKVSEREPAFLETPRLWKELYNM